MRPDKVILAALAATLRLYRAGVAQTAIPIWRQIATPLDELEHRAVALLTALRSSPTPLGPEASRGVTLGADRTESTVGGGSLPGQVIPSWALVISGPSPQRLLSGLRSDVPAVIGRVVADAVVLDLRTVDPADDGQLAAAVRAALVAVAARHGG